MKIIYRMVLVLIFALFSIVFNLYAIEEGLGGLTIISQTEMGETTNYLIEDEDGNIFTFSLKGELSPSQIDLLQSIKNTSFTLGYMVINEIKMALSGGKAEIVIIPKSFIYKGVDFREYMPSGMLFLYEDFLEYDFKMKIGDLLLRMKGQFYDEDEFYERILEAINNPILYVQTTDPEYLFRVYGELTEEIENIKTEGYRAIQSLDELKDGLGEIKSIFLDLKDDSEKIKEKINENYSTLSSTLQENYSTFNDRYSALIEKLEAINYAVLALNNHGIFGKPKPVSKEGIDRVITIKKENPSITIKEISETLGKEGMTLTEREISLILGVYFLEFQK